MNNETGEEKGGWKYNWRWIVPIIAIVLLSVGAFLSAASDGHITDFARAYADAPLYAKAVEESNANKDVQKLLGKLQPVDKMAIFESSVEYTNDYNAVHLTVRVTGSKGKGRMDVAAVKKGKAWVYKKIKVRIKKPKQEIIVLG